MTKTLARPPLFDLKMQGRESQRGVDMTRSSGFKGLPALRSPLAGQTGAGRGGPGSCWAPAPG